MLPGRSAAQLPVPHPAAPVYCARITRTRGARSARTRIVGERMAHVYSDSEGGWTAPRLASYTGGGETWREAPVEHKPWQTTGRAHTANRPAAGRPELTTLAGRLADTAQPAVLEGIPPVSNTLPVPDVEVPGKPSSIAGRACQQ